MNQHSREYFKCSTRRGEVERVVQWVKVRRAGGNDAIHFIAFRNVIKV